MTRPNAVTTVVCVRQSVATAERDAREAVESHSTARAMPWTTQETAHRRAICRLGLTTNYAYDNIYELLSVTQGANTTESYTYDPVGNRLSNLSGSGWSNNTSNELTSRPGVTYTYDNNGNTQTKVNCLGTTTYTWDYENRMTSVALPEAAERSASNTIPSGVVSTNLLRQALPSLLTTATTSSRKPMQRAQPSLATRKDKTLTNRSRCCAAARPAITRRMA